MSDYSVGDLVNELAKIRDGVGSRPNYIPGDYDGQLHGLASQLSGASEGGSRPQLAQPIVTALGRAAAEIQNALECRYRASGILESYIDNHLKTFTGSSGGGPIAVAGGGGDSGAGAAGAGGGLSHVARRLARITGWSELSGAQKAGLGFAVAGAGIFVFGSIGFFTPGAALALGLTHTLVKLGYSWHKASSQFRDDSSHVTRRAARKAAIRAALVDGAWSIAGTYIPGAEFLNSDLQLLSTLFFLHHDGTGLVNELLGQLDNIRNHQGGGQTHG